ncbi:MAG TPA: DUF1840 domain-containing protein [Candidatus Paenalcaligenes intestinipullorum]|uniref:DUF1840 domain-containing protein n=1 Tax=Candidatus Paenalcaligenes intestinipullorum TaxID=2838718 RepID=A0A9D2RJX2_9BURK|nr:DUF1840 domain-containing protein [Candidatus Paenalcaligenes intestinipullorum]
MLLAFTSNAAPNVLMFARHALPVLRAAGRPFTTELPERGVIPHDQMAQSIARLEAAIGNIPMDEPYPEEIISEDEDRDVDPAADKPINLRQRAFPLLDMMRKSLEQDTDILWEPANTDW